MYAGVYSVAQGHNPLDDFGGDPDDDPDSEILDPKTSQNSVCLSVRPPDHSESMWILIKCMQGFIAWPKDTIH